MPKLLRAVSYCPTEVCDQWKLPRFHLAPSFPDAYYHCHKCRALCELVEDSFDYTGGQPWRQVRVEFNYDPEEHRYCGVAIVTDEESKGFGVHTYRTCLIKTEKRALQVAEARLSNLSAGQDADKHYVEINFDHPLEDVKRICAAMCQV